MRLTNIQISNFRSILYEDIDLENYTLIVGANNAGKSSIMHALRVFYEDAKWNKDDIPKLKTADNEVWIELKFCLNETEWASLADKYKEGAEENILRVRRYFKSEEKDLVKANQSNIYGYVNGQLDKELFYGAKNVGGAKIGNVIFIPALSRPEDQTKMSGPSPLREMLNFMLKKVVAQSDAYKELSSAIEKLNVEAKEKNGFLQEIAGPLNAAISSWNVSVDLSVNKIEPEDISKNLMRLAFVDAALGQDGFDIEKYGHGFQRTVIYELIRMAPAFKEAKKSDKKEFSGDLTLILFEEPEAFLHPSQQDNMAFHLRLLSEQEAQQIIITTHSPTFAGKASDDLPQLVRVKREAGETSAWQASRKDVKALFEKGGELKAALESYVADPAVSDQDKQRAKKMINEFPGEEIGIQEEKFRYQLWLDSERAALFFADRVLLVEGASERALFNYLIATDWRDLAAYRICVVDVFGKYNFHRFMSLLSSFGIPHGVILDGDDGKHHHRTINDLVCASKNAHTLASPVIFPKCCEDYLGLPVPSRADKKPVEIMKALLGNKIAADRMTALRKDFESALGLS